MAKSMRTPKIPKGDSIEKLARFWDTHDLTKFEDRLEDVDEPVFERESNAVIAVRLHHREAEAVKQVAKARGVRQATLIRQWVRDRLQNNSSLNKRT